MKKLLYALSALCATFFLSSCALLEELPFYPFTSSSESLEQSSSASESIWEEIPSAEKSEEESSEEEISQEEESVESSIEDTSSEEDVEIESENSSSEEESLESESSEETSDEEINSEEGEESSMEDSSSEESSTEEPEDKVVYTFTDFDEDEKALLIRYVGEVLPFPATDYYGFEGYFEETDYENGINFFTAGNTQEDFDTYRTLFSDYTLVRTYIDDFGDTWYNYEKDDITVDMSYYYYEEEYWIDVYAYSSIWSDGIVDDDFNDEEEDGSEDDEAIVDGDGVRTVDFTQATNVKNVTDLAYYLDGCPTTGSPAVLVIPVEFSDVTAASKGYTIDKIKSAFLPNGKTDYCSVYDYYYTSSYGKLSLDITVLDSWFRPSARSSYYQRKTMDYYGDRIAIGDQIIIDEALKSLSKTMDLTRFDSDNNGAIDSIVLITTLDVNSNVDFQWAYRFWNIYTDSDGYYYEYDGVSANDYLWASYQFMHEGVDRNGNYVYTNTSALNTYTYIHEFAHVLGADDYYDTAYVDAPMKGYDVMDAMIGDHNPYTKFNYGWLTTSRLVVAEDTVTLSLEDFSKNGDTVIIANNWSDSLGAYQEYYVLMYYKNTGLNGGAYGYFGQEGILVYHVNATLYSEREGGQTYYYTANTNTNASDKGYGTEDNLIEFILAADGGYVFGVGDTLSASTTDDKGKQIAYTFTVDDLSSTYATITFVKNTL